MNNDKAFAIYAFALIATVLTAITIAYALLADFLFLPPLLIAIDTQGPVRIDWRVTEDASRTLGRDLGAIVDTIEKVTLLIVGKICKSPAVYSI